MYEIRVIVNDQERPLDMTEGSFPITIESGSIAELQDKSVDWSYSISLPRTSNNDELLERAGTPFVRSRVPYKRMPCNVYTDGVQIIRKGVMYIDSTTDKEYNVQIVSGNADVFELMDAIDFTDYPQAHLYLMPDDVAGVLYPFFVSRDGLSNTSKIGKTYAYATPIINVVDMLQGIVQNIGSDIEYDTQEDLSMMYLTPKKLIAEPIVPEIPISTTEGYEKGRGEMDYAWVGERNLAYNSDQITNRVTFRWACGTYNGVYIDITPRQAMEAYIRAGGEIVMNLGIKGTLLTQEKVLASKTYNAVEQLTDVLELVVDRDGLDAIQYEGLMEVVNTEYGLDAWVVVTNYTEWVALGVRHSGLSWANGVVARGVNELSIQGEMKDPSNYIGPLSTINLEASIGMSGLDFFKMLAQTFGWIVRVTDNKIEAHTFEYIKSRKSDAIDWSDRLAEDEGSETIYAFGEYAQNNNISYEENKVTGYQDTTSFRIPNENLDKDADVLEIGLSSGQGNIVEAWDREDSTQPYKRVEASPHLVRVSEQDISHYSAEDIRMNYQQFIDTMQDAEVLTAKMRLTALDIMRFDPYTPIYLQQYGAYYYVNKISDWEDGKICEVELLRL